MPTDLIEDDSGLATTLSPPEQLAKYLQDNWTILDPAVDDIVWQTYWMPTALVTIAFRERTLPSPMIVGWHKWQYRATVQMVISAHHEANGDYPAVIRKVRKRIEDMIHIDVTDMKDYGFSVKRITVFDDIVDYTAKTAYKDDVCDLMIEVEMLQSKTNVVTP